MKASSVRRRSKAQILEDKTASQRKEQDIKDKLASWDQMMAALQESEQKRQAMEASHNEVQKMFDEGILKMG